MKRTFLWLAAAYALLIAYGSLFPFSFVGGEAHLSGLLAWPKHYSGTDVLTNLLAYMPLGLLLGLAWQGRRSPLGSSALALLIGTALSQIIAAETARMQPSGWARNDRRRLPLAAWAKAVVSPVTPRRPKPEPVWKSAVVSRPSSKPNASLTRCWR